MPFLRLGVLCAVLDDDGRVLLSRRGDLNTWNLPGGRLDQGESVFEGVAREVHEETGVFAHIETLAGLYYLDGWDRLNILAVGWPLGGEVAKRTAEARANRYFPPNDLPLKLFVPRIIDHATATNRPEPTIISTPQEELDRLRRKLARRWVWNLLRGRPEPRFSRFMVRAVGIIWDESHRRLLLHNGALPAVMCTGTKAPWVELDHHCEQQLGVPALQFHWVGLWEDPPLSTMDLVFAVTIAETAHPGWTTARNAAITGREASFVSRTNNTYPTDAVWVITHDDPAEGIITLKGTEQDG